MAVEKTDENSEASQSAEPQILINDPLEMAEELPTVVKNETDTVETKPSSDAPLVAEQNEIDHSVPELKQIKKESVKKRLRAQDDQLVNRPTLRPRKKEPPPAEIPPKKIKKNLTKQKNAVAAVGKSQPNSCTPPDLPLVGALKPEPECGSENAEMPELTSEADSETKKRKRHRGSQKKRNIGNDDRKERTVPSPSLADGTVNPACPESSVTALEATKPPLCLCGKKPQVFVSSNNNPGDLTCQALDSLDGRVIGCCNPLPATTVGLHRPSSRTPYIMLCSVHLQRLLRHNCCPGCGLFCTQGKYLSCIGSHQYHKQCARQEGCPHCGDLAPPKSITITLKSRRDMAFLPRPKPVRLTKPAKMSVKKETAPVDEPLPVTLPPEVEKWTAALEEMPQAAALDPQDPADSDKLAQLLGFACDALITTPRALHTNSNRNTSKNLLSAVRAGDALKLLKFMSAGMNPAQVFAEMKQQNALHVASSCGHVTLVHLLIQAGVPIDLMDAEQNTALSLAVAAGHHDVVKYLVKAGASLIIKCEDGMTPLHLAAMRGNVDACSLLLSAPCLPRRYVDSLDDGGWTPLVWGCEYNHIEVVRLLIREGGDPLIRDIDQNIALHWAAFGGCVDVVELLLSIGCDISAVNVQGDTPLHIAARQDKYDCVLLLIARGARTDIKNRVGDIPRDCAVLESPIHKAISLNMELSQLVSRFNQGGPRIINNDITRGRERNPVQCINAVDEETEPKDFIYVSDSCFTSRISVDRTVTAMQSCTCEDNCTSGGCACTSISMRAWYDCEGKLGPEFSYNNPPMIFECNQTCGCNKILCQNRVVQKGVTCRFQLFRTKTRGWGVRTLNYIPKGTYVCEYIGEIITDSEADHREDDSYLFDLENRDGETYCIDARRYGNIARFINHMCVPNLIPVQVFVEHQDMRFPRIAFFANQDIQPDEEVGYNYGEKFWIIKYKTFTCTCESEKCMYSEKTIQATLDVYRKKLIDLDDLDQTI